jgi:hypothetical protein
MSSLQLEYYSLNGGGSELAPFSEGRRVSF